MRESALCRNTNVWTLDCTILYRYYFTGFYFRKSCSFTDAWIINPVDSLNFPSDTSYVVCISKIAQFKKNTMDGHFNRKLQNCIHVNISLCTVYHMALGLLERNSFSKPFKQISVKQLQIYYNMFDHTSFVSPKLLKSAWVQTVLIFCSFTQ